MRFAALPPAAPAGHRAPPTLLLLGVVLLGARGPARGQEMPPGLTLPVELGQGFNHARGGDALYLATLQLTPQWTLVPGRLRAGPTLGLFYPGTRLGALAGGRLTLRVAQGPPVFLGSSFHVHLLAEYLPLVRDSPDRWRQWVGAGVGVETSNLLTLSLKLHRDLTWPATYGQLAVAFNLRYQQTLPGRL